MGGDSILRLRSEGTGRWTRIAWYLSGVFHRADGPAHIFLRTNGSRYEAYYFRGELHRADGPAVITSQACAYYNKNKHIISYSLSPGVRTIPTLSI